MSARRTYTPDEKAAALELYRTDGPTAVEEATGIPKNTVASWARRNGVHTDCTQRTTQAVQAMQAKWAERRAVMVDEIGAVAHMALSQAEASVRVGRARDAKDFATTLAILVDKAQLLGGDATERHESRQLRAELLEQARENAKHLRAVS